MLQDAADGWTPRGGPGFADVAPEMHATINHMLEERWLQPVPGSCCGLQVDGSERGIPPGTFQKQFSMDRQGASTAMDAHGGQLRDPVFLVLGVCKTDYVTATLHIGKLPDPHANDPSTPPMASTAIDLKEMYEVLNEQVQDPARGWGVLMDDVRRVLKPSRFTENAGRCTLPHGKITWPVFVRTVLYMLHR